MSKELGKWELTILDIKVCKPRKSIKVIAKHPFLDVYAVKFDCKKFYEYTFNEKENMYYLEPEDCKYCVPFSPEEFYTRFEDVCVEDKA